MPIPRSVVTAPAKRPDSQGNTPKVTARVPGDLLSAALARAQEIDPAVVLSGVIRYAVALLAGLPEETARKHLRDLPIGAKSARNRS